MTEITFTKWLVGTFFGMLFQSIGLVLFVLGFFPVKPALKGTSGIESLSPNCLEDIYHVSTSEGSTHKALQEKLEVKPQYDRAVLMIIDGLPAEFVLGRGGLPPPRRNAAAMPFTQGLLSSKEAIGFHAKAAPPTVTMPRLKAITSGAIAGFLDVAFNFNTQAMVDDNLIGQLERQGWKMVMYGDETWLRLFSTSFVCHDGVSSFYVKDTIQVDNNVTRHLDEVLVRDDWDFLILHYLGLDHVGHLGGRASTLMVPKLQEMDGVIEMLHTALVDGKSKIVDRETLLMVVSDHGMTHGGNHGGASFEETDALALFSRRKAFTIPSGDQASQVDLVPTLALLLGVPIPKNSVGVLLPQLFDTLTAAEKLRVLEINSWQLMRLLRVRSPKTWCLRSICSGEEVDVVESKANGAITGFCYLFGVARRLHESWKVSGCNLDASSCSSLDVEEVSRAYLSFLHAASDWLAKGTTEKKILRICIGGFLMILSAMVFLRVCRLLNGEPCFSKFENLFGVAGVCGHALSFNSSSLVEEEQFTLHFLVVTLWCLFLRRICQQQWPYQPVGESMKPLWSLLPAGSRHVEGGNSDITMLEPMVPGICDWRRMSAQAFAIVLVVVMARAMRGWHRSGVNWAHLPDTAKWLEKSGPWVLLGTELLSLATVTVVCCLLVLEGTLGALVRRIVAGALALAALAIMLHNLRVQIGGVSLVDQSLIKLAQLAYVLLGGIALATLLWAPFGIWFSRRESSNMGAVDKVLGDWCMCVNLIGKVFVSCWCVLQLLLQQPVNSVPVLLLLLQLISCLVFFNMAGATVDSWLKVVTLYWMGLSGHFGMGNTNTLATVDVAGAYIGLSQHSFFLSGLLAFIITYAAPLLYMMGALSLVSLFDGGGCIRNEREPWILKAIALPFTVPLMLSSVILVSFTMIMLLMQGHLFIWSVFSPKYIYVCFTVLSTYLGVMVNALVSCYVYVIQSMVWSRARVCVRARHRIQAISLMDQCSLFCWL